MNELQNGFTYLILALSVPACGGTAADREAPAEAPVEVPVGATRDRLELPGVGSFATSDREAWRVVVGDGDGGSERALELTRDSAYEPPFRSPHSIALIADRVYGDFALDVEVQQTGPEYAHRDLCVIFAFESPSRFAYIHFASKPDANAHNVFVVDGAPRRNLLPPHERGVEWGTNAWHRIRIERTLADGRVRAFFDDLEHPLFDVVVPLGVGRIGFGSFDDTGKFRRVRIEGDATPAPPDDPFAPHPRS